MADPDWVREELRREDLEEELWEYLDEEERFQWCEKCWDELPQVPYPAAASRLLDQGLYPSIELINEELERYRTRSKTQFYRSCRGCGRALRPLRRPVEGREDPQAKLPAPIAEPSAPPPHPDLKTSIWQALRERRRQQPVRVARQRLLAREKALFARRAARRGPVHRPRARARGRRRASRSPPSPDRESDADPSPPGAWRGRRSDSAVSPVEGAR